MAEIKWYKRDPDAALAGMMSLSLEERGAYNTVLDLIYSRADKLPDDDAFICGFLKCDPRVWKRLKDRLISAGKLYVEDGLIRNKRASYEVTYAVSRALLVSELNRSKGIKSGDVRRQNKDLAEPSANRQRTQPQPYSKEGTKVLRKEGEKSNGKVYVKSGTPAGDAWDAFFKARGKPPRRDFNGGWWFPSEFPPGDEPQVNQRRTG